MHDLQKSFEQILDFIKGIWVKKRYVMLVSWLMCPAGFIYVASLPPVYESKARVYVDTRSVLQPLLKGLAVTTNPQDEISRLAKTLLSRKNLEAIARETDMDIEAETQPQFEALMLNLANDIKLKRAGRDSIYSITYENKDPELAKLVVQETLDLFREDSLGESRQDSDSAGRFLDEQINDYEQRLASSEQRLADFKRKYSDILPVQGSFYSNLQNLKMELEKTRLEVRETEQQSAALREQVLSQQRQVDDFSVQDSSNSSGGLKTRFDERIKALEEDLDQLQLRFTDKHPDVIEANSLLDRLLKLREKELQAYRESFQNDDGTENLDFVESDVSLEIGRLDGLIASLKVREQDYVKRIEELEQKIDLVPQIEAESTALNRDYGITQKKYEELLSRKESAELSQAAEISSEGLQFRVIEPPILPQAPAGPKRLLLYAVVLIFGFGAGFALAFLISQLSPILVRGHQLTAMTSIPVLGNVTHLHIDQMRKVDRRNLAIFILSSGMIFSIFSVLAAAEVLNINLYTKVFS